jgi:energy-converting hydrogenase Eha subunit C
LFLHPPGILLVLAPFAGLGQVLTDSTGFAVARTFFMLLGALNAALLTRIAGRLGLVAAAVAGLFYGVWYPSMYAARTTLLEPVGTTGLLVALLLLLWARRTSVRAEVLAGVALGLASAVKIWCVVPALVVVLWQLQVAGWRASSRVVAGAAMAVVGVCLPFFLLAPEPMFRMVVRAQIGRPVSDRSRLGRLARISSLEAHLVGWGQVSLALAVGAAGLLVLAAAVTVWRRTSSRIVVILLLATGMVLLVSPSYFGHYGEFVAAPLALTLAVAAQRLVDWGAGRERAIRAVTITAVVVPMAALVVAASTITFGTSVSWPDRARAEAVPGCVYADVPTALIQLDVLSSSLRRSCPVWVDVIASTYLPGAQRGPGGSGVDRRLNRAWQRDLMGYLTSGSAAVFVRPQELSPASVRRLSGSPLLATTSHYRIYGAQTSPAGR